ncbi:unnamed protein product [Moneuplotes crassus]|uniref:Uncharacterized protein n=1 Tax=Euplotes crassus TaxID=5936 RepID=A0AAD1U3U8_EUPCR|nr:unnamed protein product [Moneuplotes crassus]
MSSSSSDSADGDNSESEKPRNHTVWTKRRTRLDSQENEALNLMESIRTFRAGDDLDK